jgi:diguanylate cyclase (GGDEF)-like protein
MKISLFIITLLLMIASFVLVKEGNVFPFVILFFSVPIILGCYFYGIIWAYLVSAVCTAFCIGLIKLGLSALPMWLSVVNFNLFPLVVFRFDKLFKRCQQDSKNKISEVENIYQQLLKEDNEIKSVNARLEKDVLEMARLYEITKAMSATMEFSGIFLVFKNILQKTVKFSSAKLILVAQKPAQGNNIGIQKFYRIQPADNIQALEDEKLAKLGTGATPFLDSGSELVSKDEIETAEPSDFDRALTLEFDVEGRKPLIVGLAQAAGVNAKARQLPEGVKSIVAVGLFYENSLIGILAAENITEEGIDRFLIVASQFELELQKVMLYEMVQQLAIMDGLTDIFVRRYFLERCQHELRRSIKHKLDLACLMVDIDFFKDCNDKYGHLVGDVVLRQIADIIKANIREVDFAGRYGGEEFCVALPDTAKAGAVHVAQRLRSSVEHCAFKAYDEEIKATVSVGVAVFPEDASDLNQLIDYADRAMYKAKAEGRNKVCVWS